MILILWISKREVLILTDGSELEVLLLLVQLTIDVDRERTVSTKREPRDTTYWTQA